jgi:hypothetical protein
MKAFKAIAFFMFVAFAAQAQTVTAAALIEKAACPEITCVDNFLKSTGFTEGEVYQDGDNTTGFYKVEAAIKDSTGHYNSFMVTMDSKSSSLSFSTFEGAKYTTLLSEFTALGFKETPSDGNTDLRNYKASKYKKYKLTTNIVDNGSLRTYVVVVEYTK